MRPCSCLQWQTHFESQLLHMQSRFAKLEHHGYFLAKQQQRVEFFQRHIQRSAHSWHTSDALTNNLAGGGLLHELFLPQEHLSAEQKSLKVIKKSQVLFYMNDDGSHFSELKNTVNPERNVGQVMLFHEPIC